jgi:hypothetical protein
MSVTMKDFIGSWKINWATGKGNVLEQEGVLLIGTDSEWGDLAPTLSDEYRTCVGFAMVADGKLVELSSDGDAPVGLSSGGHEGHQPLFLMLDGNQLRWTGYYEQKPVRIFISAAEVQIPGGERYITLYGNTLYGDPEQVGVWGGIGSPPPPPPPP